MVVTGWSQPTIVTRPGSRSTSSYASRRAAAAGVLPLVESAAREADLSLVRPQPRGAPGQDQPGLARLLEERGQDAGVDVLHRRGVGLVDDGGPAEHPVRSDVVGHRTALAHGLERVEHPVEADPGPPRLRGGRPTAPGRRAARWPGAGSPGAAPVGTSPSRYRRPAALSAGADGRRTAGRAPRYALAAMTSPEDLQAQADALHWYHTIDLGNGVVTKGDSAQDDGTGDPPRRLRPQRPRHRGVGREVLVPGRAGRGDPGRRARPLRLGRRLRGPRRLLGRVHPARHAPRPVPGRDGLLAARPARDGAASSWRQPRWARRSSRWWPTSRPSTSTRSASSTSSSTSACCTT